MAGNNTYKLFTYKVHNGFMTDSINQFSGTQNVTPFIQTLFLANAQAAARV